MRPMRRVSGHSQKGIPPSPWSSCFFLVNSLMNFVNEKFSISHSVTILMIDSEIQKITQFPLILYTVHFWKSASSTAFGLKTKEGVVLVVEKRITSPLLEPSSMEKIMEIDEHIGCATSGLIADAYTLVEHARVETHNHRFSYGEPMTMESTMQALCDLALKFGEGDEESMAQSYCNLIKKSINKKEAAEMTNIEVFFSFVG
uniref:Proteasome subunit alpha type-5 n=1 Tax=Cucumis melo TaxID=3656 RepID=A0A9I9DXH9_CUCME